MRIEGLAVGISLDPKTGPKLLERIGEVRQVGSVARRTDVDVDRGMPRLMESRHHSADSHEVHLMVDQNPADSGNMVTAVFRRRRPPVGIPVTATAAVWHHPASFPTRRAPDRGRRVRPTPVEAPDQPGSAFAAAWAASVAVAPTRSPTRSAVRFPEHQQGPSATTRVSIGLTVALTRRAVPRQYPYL